MPRIAPQANVADGASHPLKSLAPGGTASGVAADAKPKPVASRWLVGWGRDNVGEPIAETQPYKAHQGAGCRL